MRTRLQIAAAIALALGSVAALARTGEKPMHSVALIGSKWIVEQIGGRAADKEARASLQFHDDGSLSGTGSCNGLSAQYTLEGQRLSFSPVVTTMMLCPEPAMDQEQRLLDLLETVTAWRIDTNGALILEAGNGTAIVACASAQAR